MGRWNFYFWNLRDPFAADANFLPAPLPSRGNEFPSMSIRKYSSRTTWRVKCCWKIVFKFMIIIFFAFGFSQEILVKFRLWETSRIFNEWRGTYEAERMRGERFNEYFWQKSRRYPIRVPLRQFLRHHSDGQPFDVEEQQHRRGWKIRGWRSHSRFTSFYIFFASPKWKNEWTATLQSIHSSPSKSEYTHTQCFVV